MSENVLTNQILQFWFEDLDLSVEMERREVWFKSTPEFDDAIRTEFESIHAQAAAGELDHLKETREGCLALILVLDQFSRNMFRGTAKAFSSDAKAVELARYALEQNYADGLSPWHATFFYLPFEHSEDLADQDEAVRLYRELGIDTAIKAAEGHRDCIQRFGRFPFRNKALGRTNTPEEEEYLKDPPPWGQTKAEFEAHERRRAQEKQAAKARSKPGD